ncbi:2-acylglycerol O-acyltransferase 2-A [Zootermopsis nevadensis]|uniref:2-acylglycerol O-acyltransferase 2-A n=1 Tax=Zootermopsis nevadensis TaxID=136037 RepID=A0A067R9Z0_ZOONE|nr:2-acylglycerol O-acyltransferase 2-A [Zootermopsis nevadensis]
MILRWIGWAFEKRSEWARRWVWWDYLRDYFPLRLEKTVELDPTRTYMFCVFPHGVLSTGAFLSFATEASKFSKLFPGLRPYLVTLAGHFIIPFIRELSLALGGCPSSVEALSYVLSRPGNAVALVVGGASESLECRPGTYKIILKRRKGFVKLALMHGTPLVPVFSFGETDLYDQVNNPKGSWLRWAQELCRKMTGIAPVLPLGRGLFQYSFGIVPHRRPVTTVGNMKEDFCTKSFNRMLWKLLQDATVGDFKKLNLFHPPRILSPQDP